MRADAGVAGVVGRSLGERAGALHRALARPWALGALLAVNLAAYVAGVVLWYGPVLTDPQTPAWAWPFIPDCPLFALLGGLGLLMATAQRFWSLRAQERAQRWLLNCGAAALLVWLILETPGARAIAPALHAHRALWALLGASFVVFGVVFKRAPVWFLCLVAAGQIKYGIWTVTAWGLFWRNTNALFGEPLLTAEGVLMTASHVGLAAQGLALLSYVRPSVAGAAAATVWFGLSDFVDYGLGWYPPIPPIIPLDVMQNSTIAVTWLLGLGLLLAAHPWRGVRRRAAPESA